MKNRILGVFLAALAMFAWGSIFWLSPLPIMGTGQVSGSVALGAALNEHLGEDGVYFLPDALEMSEDPEAWATHHQAGPLAMIVYQHEGYTPMDPRLMISGFIHMLVAVGLMAAILGLVVEALVTYRRRLGFVILLGVLIGFHARIGDTIWFLHPLGWGMTGWIATIGAWAAAGAVLAVFNRPAMRRTASSPSKG